MLSPGSAGVWRRLRGERCLAEVLMLAGQPAEAASALEQALDRYERKGNDVSTRRAQTRLAELRKATPDEVTG